MLSVRLLVRVLRPLAFWTPRRYRVMTSATAVGTTTHRVVHRVHRDGAHRRANTTPAIGTSLADDAERVLTIADFTDRGSAVNVPCELHLSANGSARRYLHEPSAAPKHQPIGQFGHPCRVAVRSHESSCPPGYCGSAGHYHLDRCLGAALDRIACSQAFRGVYITTFAISVKNQAMNALRLDHIPDAPPWPGCRPCCDGSRRCGSDACDRRPCDG